MIISISGKAGSGKGTVSDILVQTLGSEFISVGNLRRKLAAEMGLDIIEFNKLGEKPENAREFDIKYEDYQKELDLNANIVLDSRLGWYCQPDSFKVFLDVEDYEGARRIMGDDRATDNQETLEEAVQVMRERNQSDSQRYQNLYGIDHLDHNNFDLVVDTTDKTPQQAADMILEKFKEFESNK